MNGVRLWAGERRHKSHHKVGRIPVASTPCSSKQRKDEREFVDGASNNNISTSVYFIFVPSFTIFIIFQSVRRGLFFRPRLFRKSAVAYRELIKSVIYVDSKQHYSKCISLPSNVGQLDSFCRAAALCNATYDLAMRILSVRPSFHWKKKVLNLNLLISRRLITTFAIYVGS